MLLRVRCALRSAPMAPAGAPPEYLRAIDSILNTYIIILESGRSFFCISSAEIPFLHNREAETRTHAPRSPPAATPRPDRTRQSTPARRGRVAGCAQPAHTHVVYGWSEPSSRPRRHARTPYTAAPSRQSSPRTPRPVPEPGSALRGASGVRDAGELGSCKAAFEPASASRVRGGRTKGASNKAKAGTSRYM